jgi:hypothetical protein
VNDETKQRVVTVLAAGMTFVLSRLVTQRFKGARAQGRKGRRLGSGLQGG